MMFRGQQQPLCRQMAPNSEQYSLIIYNVNVPHITTLNSKKLSTSHYFLDIKVISALCNFEWNFYGAETDKTYKKSGLEDALIQNVLA